MVWWNFTTLTQRTIMFTETVKSLRLQKRLTRGTFATKPGWTRATGVKWSEASIRRLAMSELWSGWPVFSVSLEIKNQPSWTRRLYSGGRYRQMWPITSSSKKRCLHSSEQRVVMS